MSIFRLSVVVIMATLFLSGCNEENTASGTVKNAKIEIATAYPLDLPIMGDALKHIESVATEASNGSIKIRLGEPGNPVPAKEILDAVSEGSVDAGYGAAGFWKGKLPAAPIFSSVPFGPETGEYLAWMYEGNGLTLYQKMYDDGGYNVKVLIAAVLPPETSGWFKESIDSPEQLKGLKMRFFGFGGDVMSRLGVSVEALSGGDIFPALEKGRLDAAEFSMPAIDKRLGFHKVVSYNYFPGWHQQATILELLINKDVWNDLAPSQQKIIELACRSSVVGSIAKGEAAQFSVMNDQVNNLGVTRKIWSPEMLTLFRSTWEEIAAEKAKEDAFFAEVWKDLNEFRAGYDAWESHALLPRAEAE